VLANVTTTAGCFSCVGRLHTITRPSGEVVGTIKPKGLCLGLDYIITADGGPSYRVNSGAALCHHNESRIRNVDTKAVVGGFGEKKAWCSPRVTKSVTYAQDLSLNEKLLFIICMCMRHGSFDRPTSERR
jgi:hypothetical protein